jgi:hypothetical protein
MSRSTSRCILRLQSAQTRTLYSAVSRPMRAGLVCAPTAARWLHPALVYMCHSTTCILMQITSLNKDDAASGHSACHHVTRGCHAPRASLGVLPRQQHMRNHSECSWWPHKSQGRWSDEWRCRKWCRKGCHKQCRCRKASSTTATEAWTNCMQDAVQRYLRSEQRLVSGRTPQAYFALAVRLCLTVCVVCVHACLLQCITISQWNAAAWCNAVCAGGAAAVPASGPTRVLTSCGSMQCHCLPSAMPCSYAWRAKRGERNNSSVVLHDAESAMRP